MYLYVRAKSGTPIAFRAGRDKSREETLGYVPGSALIGAFAAAHKFIRPGRNEEFESFFLNNNILFGNLYPSKDPGSKSNKNPLDSYSTSIRPVPKTARTCKRFQGFKYNAAEEDEGRHGVWDSLVAWAVFSLSDMKNANELENLMDCTCGEPMDAFSGFYRRGDDETQWASYDAKKGFFTRTGINRKLGVVEESIIYNREFLQAGNNFFGDWWIDPALKEDFEQFVEDTASGILRVGHNRTRGLGKITFPDGLNNQELDTFELVKNRVLKFGKILNGKAGEFSKYKYYLPITLVSDCILTESPGFYNLKITPNILEKELGIAGSSLIYCNASTRKITGWNVLWGLPKTDELAITMGSVFLFGFNSEPDWNKLAEIQSRGIGIRKSEGFGMVRFADEFHMEVNGV